MSSDETFRNLLAAFKIALKNASFYQLEHPAFLSSVEELKGKIDTLINDIGPLKIGFTPNSLFFENRYWEEDRTFKEIARIFHFRKVKTLEIQKGFALQELAAFVSAVQLPPTDIYRSGGLQNILKDRDILHMAVEELDYTQLLQGEGEEVKDVWAYLLDEAIEKQDDQELDQVAESFERIATQLEPEDFTEKEELDVNIGKLMRYMKKAQEERFHTCAKTLVKAFVKNKKMAPASKMEKLRVVFADIGEEDFASALWEEIATDTGFDSLSFSIFSKLTEKDKQERIAAKLKEEAQKDEDFSSSEELRKKVKELLSGTSSPYVSEIYKETLSSLLRDISIQKAKQLDRRHLTGNFRYALLNLFATETDNETRKTILTRILEEWDDIKETGDFEYLKNLATTLKEKDSGFSSETIAIKTNKMIAVFVEKAVLGGQTSPYFSLFLDTMEQSSLGVNDYLQRVFSEGKITPYILQFFFKFFSDSMLYFMINLEERSSDLKLLDRLTDNLRLIDSPLSLEVMKAIFPLGNNHVKIKVLRAMQQLSTREAEFLMPILQKGSYPLKKEALIILVKNAESREIALDTLLSLSSPFGLKNSRLRKHIQIVGDAAITEARDHVFALSRKKDFWNRRVRHEAKRALEKLDDRKD